MINFGGRVKWSNEIETEIIIKNYEKNINIKSLPKNSILKANKVNCTNH